MLFPSLYANTPSVGGFDMMSLMPIFMIGAVFYFLILRPQQKKMKDHQSLLSSIKNGDRVVTNGGMIGVVVKVENETEIKIEIASGVHVRVMRAMIANVVSNGSMSISNQETTDAEKGTKSASAKSAKTAVKPKAVKKAEKA